MVGAVSGREGGGVEMRRKKEKEYEGEKKRWFEAREERIRRERRLEKEKREEDGREEEKEGEECDLERSEG